MTSIKKPIAVANRVGVRVTTPFSMMISDEAATFSAMFYGFGGKVGTGADSDWSIIDPYAQTLISLECGYSCVELGRIDDGGMRDILQKWG